MKKNKNLDTSILRKISARIQFRKNSDGEYVVERKSYETGEWEIIARSKRFSRALMKKHNAQLAELSRLSYTSELLLRRKHGKSSFFHKRRKKRSKK